jgi:hypothetical protein
MTKQKKILIPTENAESWRNFLADKEKHWKPGFSAMSIAYSWEKSQGIPTEILDVLLQLSDFKGLDLLISIPEYKVPLPGGNKPSQNDILAVFTTEKELSVMTIEGKAKENFDDTISVWKARTSDFGVEERLGYILRKIGINNKYIDNLRYQLFHRLASAVVMAEKFHAKNAIMIVQSFNNKDTENHFGDFVDFLKLYNYLSIEKSKLYRLTEVNGIEIFAGWVYSDWKKSMAPNTWS